MSTLTPTTKAGKNRICQLCGERIPQHDYYWFDYAVIEKGHISEDLFRKTIFSCVRMCFNCVLQQMKMLVFTLIQLISQIDYEDRKNRCFCCRLSL